MSQKRFVHLSDEERSSLLKITRSGVRKTREIARARILLLADRNQAGWKTQEQIAEAMVVSPVTVSRTCRRFVREGSSAALRERPRPGQAPKITGTGEVEAHLMAIAYSRHARLSRLTTGGICVGVAFKHTNGRRRVQTHLIYAACHHLPGDVSNTMDRLPLGSRPSS